MKKGIGLAVIAALAAAIAASTATRRAEDGREVAERQLQEHAEARAW